MKQLIAGTTLLLVLGIGAFVYRAIVEKPASIVEQACTTEAMLCPDGSSVGRTGPNCSFAPCPVAEVTLIPFAGISFVLPTGYVEVNFMDSPDFLAAYDKATGEGIPHTIAIHLYAIPEGKTAEQVMLEHTRYQPSDMAAQDLSRFGTSVIGGRTFRATVIERFEGQARSSYFLARTNDVLRFDIGERGVDWTNPDLQIETLPEHQALQQMLSTLTIQ